MPLTNYMIGVFSMPGSCRHNNPLMSHSLHLAAWFDIPAFILTDQPITYHHFGIIYVAVELQLISDFTFGR